MNVQLELKVIADVGLVGFPNVGKSTFLSRVTNANPKIANYHFTTLNPNLGVVDLGDGESFVIADIPGLIEGASEGVGLGHEFLRHIERTKMMIHVVDAASSEGRDPVDDIYKINCVGSQRPRRAGAGGRTGYADCPLVQRQFFGPDWIYERRVRAGDAFPVQLCTPGR